MVKNVAGYDLMRLHAGAHGAFGFITEVTLRLSPRPEAHAPFERAFDDARRAADAAWRIAREAPALGLVGVDRAGPASPRSWRGCTRATASRWRTARAGARPRTASRARATPRITRRRSPPGCA